MSKLSLVGDDRSAKLIARLLRDAGVEAIYTGSQEQPEGVMEAAIQEDADAVALSILSGDHMTVVPRILELLRAAGAGVTPVIVGGAISSGDAAELQRLGMSAVLQSGRAIEQVGTLLRCKASRMEPCH